MAGPYRVPQRLLHLLVRSPISHETGITGLSVLTKLVTRIANADLPDLALPTLAAATLLPPQKKPDEIHPIAVGSVFRRIVTKTLLPAAIDESRDILAPFQTANGIKAAMDTIVHDTSTMLRRFASARHVFTALIYAQNALT